MEVEDGALAARVVDGALAALVVVCVFLSLRVPEERPSNRAASPGPLSGQTAPARLCTTAKIGWEGDDG